MKKKIFRLLSKQISEKDLFYRETIEICGTASLENFYYHLVRSNAQDYDVEVIKKLLDKEETKCH